MFVWASFSSVGVWCCVPNRDFKYLVGSSCFLWKPVPLLPNRKTAEHNRELEVVSELVFGDEGVGMVH